MTPWTAARQASLSIINSRNLPKLMSIELVMPSNHLILCCPLLLSYSIFPSIRVFSNESALRIRWPKYWSFSFHIVTTQSNILAWGIPMDRGPWQATVHGVQSPTRLSNWTELNTICTEAQRGWVTCSTSYSYFGKLLLTKYPMPPLYFPTSLAVSWKRKQLTPVFLPGESLGERSLAGYSQCIHKESDPAEQLKVTVTQDLSKVILQM